jgi:hypothetical protein
MHRTLTVKEILSFNAATRLDMNVRLLVLPAVVGVLLTMM